ncbi:PaaI family thioesterase [Ancylobacter terrae]|uniref:PaaI family thioesterase n=1 Tax=Ancylobacter sp. sgz301288 TaxID=3342077 RepID=UPI00385E045C
MTLSELQDFLAREFPQAFGPGRPHSVMGLEHHAATVRLDAGEEQLRPGGTISGPAMMGLADVAAYAAILGAIGEVPLAVTTSFSINFLRKPTPGPLLAEARLMKLGRRLAVCNVDITSGAGRELCAHAVTTYSIPNREG